MSHSAQASLASSLASERQGSLLAAWPTWRGLIKTLLLTDTECSPGSEEAAVCVVLCTDQLRLRMLQIMRT